MRVQNKSIIVTGAGNGIGEGIAKRLAAEGGKVIVNDINEVGGQRVVAEGRHRERETIARRYARTLRCLLAG